MKLNTVQQTAVDRVASANDQYRAAKLTLEAAIRKELAVRLAAVERDQDVAVRSAFELGVPKSQIGKFGLRTTSPNTVNESLARTESAPVTTEAQAVERFTWTEAGEILVTMHGEDWDTWLAAVASGKSYPRFRPEGSFVNRHDEKTAILTWDGQNVGYPDEFFFEKSGQNMIDHPVIGFLKLNGGFEAAKEWAQSAA